MEGKGEDDFWEKRKQRELLKNKWGFPRKFGETGIGGGGEHLRSSKYLIMQLWILSLSPRSHHSVKEESRILLLFIVSADALIPDYIQYLVFLQTAIQILDYGDPVAWTFCKSHVLLRISPYSVSSSENQKWQCLQLPNNKCRSIPCWK